MDEGFLGRAHQLLNADHAAQAEQLAREVLGRDPESAPAFEVLARALTEQGRGPEAVEAAHAGLAVAPEDFSLGLALANALVAARKSHEARGVAASLVTAHPHSSSAHYALAQAELGVPGPQPRRALVAAREAQRLAPHDADVRNLCGVCYDALGHREWARSAFDSALEIEPTHALALANLAAMDIGSLRVRRGGSRLTMAMLTSPHSELLQRHFVRQLTRIGFGFFGLAAVSLFVVLSLTFQPWWLHASVATGLTIGLVALAVPVVRSLPRGLRNWAPLVWSRANRYTRLSLVVGVLMVVAMLALGFAPSSSHPASAGHAATGDTTGSGASTGTGIGRIPYGLAVILLVVLAQLAWWQWGKRHGRDDVPPPSEARETERRP